MKKQSEGRREADDGETGRIRKDEGYKVRGLGQDDKIECVRQSA